MMESPGDSRCFNRCASCRQDFRDDAVERFVGSDLQEKPFTEARMDECVSVLAAADS